ncbi:thiamine pyrophosphate-dependent enzyme [Paraburkholderia strydomiana]|uniref:thiamine pyrophosphate-dependent enzyme n=1 Tax=Paraburkholderia strydomiana TaxID=1245417 RepID=UPI0020360157|nr:thiamine pyrophosphate-dependent enzyme [Paraburkholderia strydomiana]
MIPSSIEIVNPVVQVIASSRAEVLGQGACAVLPAEVRGGQILAQETVTETMNLSNTKGYGTAETIHVVVNNPLAFATSDLRDARSFICCTNIAKVIEAPVLRGNGDVREAVIAATRLAVDFRATVQKSVVVMRVAG